MSLELSRKASAVKPSSTLAITAKAKSLKKSGVDVVGFVAGEPDFNTPKNICDAAIKAIKDGFTKYTPASGMDELKKAVCDKFKRVNNINYDTNQVVISNGGKHSLTNVFAAILNPGDEVIIPSPYWLSYPEMVKLSDGVPVFVRCESSQRYKLTIEQLDAAYTDKTKALILTSPSNPTGMIYSREELEKIADWVCKHDIYVVSDEIYENLIYTGEKNVSIASLNDEIYKRTITVNGLAKSYAMTGWRIGYIGASVEIAKLISSVQSHQTSNPNSIAQVAAIEALNGDQSSVDMMLAAFKNRRDLIYEAVCSIDYLSAIEPEGAFYLFVDCSEALKHSYKGIKLNDASDLAKYLLDDYNVAVIPCADFGFPDHIRLAYAISEESIKKGMDRIAEFIKNLD